MSDTAKLMLLALVMVAGIAIGWPMAGWGSPQPQLLSQHSQSAVRLPAKMVAINPSGKLFHDPKCNAIHGHYRMVSADEASKMGYTPCTRCMREALARP